MTDHIVRLDPARPERSEDGEAGRNQRRLLDGGVDELTPSGPSLVVEVRNGGQLASHGEPLAFRPVVRSGQQEVVGEWTTKGGFDPFRGPGGAPDARPTC